jgi:hypothetical protein
MQYPGIKVTVDKKDISPVVNRFELNCGLFDRMDLLTLSFRDLESSINPNLNKGNAIHIQWGYDNEFQDLFEGVISSVNTEIKQVTLKALDYSVVFNSMFIAQTFVEETASNILNTVLAESGLSLRIEESDLTYKVFPIFNESVTEVVQKITEDVSRHTGIPQIYFTRGKTFTWKALDTSITPVMSFATGKNIVRWKGKELTTLIVPVFTGDMVTINDTNNIVESAVYRWDSGGRTVLGVSVV